MTAKQYARIVSYHVTTFLAILFLGGALFGQGAAIPGSTALMGPGNLLRALPFAKVIVCNYPATGGTPCTNYATTYNTPAVNSSCPTASPVVTPTTSTCSGTSDSQGNFVIFGPAGSTYTYYFQSANVWFGPYVATAGGGSGGGLPLGNPQQIPVVNLSGSAYAPQSLPQINAAYAGIDCTGTTSSVTTWNSVVSAGSSVMFPQGCIFKVGSNLSIPATVSLFFSQGAMLRPSTGVTVTVNGSVVAGDRQQIVDYTNGTVKFVGSARVPLDWYGAVNDGVTDDCLPLQAALNTGGDKFSALKTAASTLGGGTASTIDYYSSCTLHLKYNGTILTGPANDDWQGAPVILFAAGVTGIQIDPGCQGCTILNLEVIGGGKPAGNSAACYNSGNALSYPFTGATDGILVYGGEPRIEHTQANCNARDGIHIDGTNVSLNGQLGQPDDWFVLKGGAYSNQHNALYIHGGDTNAGIEQGFMGYGSGSWGIQDWSTTGTSHTSPQVTGNGRDAGIAAKVTSTISSISCSTTLCSVVAATPVASIQNGIWIVIAGTTNYNGVFYVTNFTDTTHFSYSQVAASRATETAGTVGVDGSTDLFANAIRTTSDASCSSIASPTMVTSQSAQFGDDTQVGAAFNGVGMGSGGGLLTTTIATVINEYAVTLASPCLTTVSNAQITYGGGISHGAYFANGSSQWFSPYAESNQPPSKLTNRNGVYSGNLTFNYAWGVPTVLTANNTIIAPTLQVVDPLDAQGGIQAQCGATANQDCGIWLYNYNQTAGWKMFAVGSSNDQAFWIRDLSAGGGIPFRATHAGTTEIDGATDVALNPGSGNVTFFNTTTTKVLNGGGFLQNSASVPAFTLFTVGSHFEHIYTCGSNCLAIGGAASNVGIPASAIAQFSESVGATFSNLIVSGTTTLNVTGSTQCLHVSTLGVVSGTGSDCGAGAGGGTVTHTVGALGSNFWAVGGSGADIETLDQTTNKYVDIPTSSAPGNPSAGSQRIYANSGGGVLACLTSAGANCLPGTAIEVNGGASITSPVNFQTGTGGNIVNGITIAASNPSGSNIQFAISGSLANAGLANSSLSFNGTTVALGASGNIPFQTIGVNNTSLAGLNFVASATNAVGLTVTPSNPGTNQERLEITGGAYTGTASNLSGTPALPNGTTATTQAPGDNTTKLATDAFVLANALVNPMTTPGDMIVGGAVSGGIAAATRLPVNAGAVQQTVVSVAGSTALTLPGLAGRCVGLNTGSCPGTTSDTILNTDCSPYRIEYAGSSATAVTLPTATTLGVPKCGFKVVNNLSTVADLTITPTTWTINGGTSVLVHNGQLAFIGVDPNNATNWVADISEQTLTVGSGLTATRTATGLSIASTSSGGTVTQIVFQAPLTGGTVTTTGTVGCPTCATGASAFTNAAIVTGTSSVGETLQTPCATCTLDSSGNFSVSVGGSVGSADTGAPKFTFGSNKATFNQALYGGAIGVSDVTAQATSQTSTVVATAPGAGNYNLRFYADTNTACTTGANTVSFVLNWTDATAARSLTTGSLSMGSSTAASYLSGELPIRVASGNVTYTSTVTGSCATGSSSYDVHMVLMQ